eukprot:CAMPEP_0194567926 /NCGR_PEP_ID=MMETSP0292-20121207/6228_1 /TAXON_ID=39354 /ORGANISM="Heterosigma akashiwo, Strain CCMP2393" /LENGTH=185 /DNA_ID=CAMNT_0039417837 /DNA_START=118 /DNA_END=675 /DNA_ORIENTATION=+
MNFLSHTEETQNVKMVWNRRKQEWVPAESAAAEAPAAQPEAVQEEESDKENEDTQNQVPDQPTEDVPQKVSSNAYASGVSQNTGNFITDRPTTRVHAAPGGKSSFSLAHDQPENPRTANKQANAQPGQLAAAPQSAAPAQPAQPQKVSSNSYASGHSQNTGNFITDKPTTRVRAPPGGSSTITFG